MTVRGSCEVLLDGLRANFPAGKEVFVTWPRQIRYWCKREKKWKHCYGDTSRVGAKLRIRMSRRMNPRYRDAWDTLIHEWVHCMEWKSAVWEDHPAIRDGDRDHAPAFWAQYGEIIDWFYHEGGREHLGL